MSSVVVEQRADGLSRTRGADVELAFRVVGDGEPVVLLHGTSATHAVWEPITAALASRATVVSLDQRGHGRSDTPESGYDGASFADDVIMVLDSLGFKCAVVVGHSLGARNAWVAAARHPGRVSAVVAVDYVPYVEPSVLDALQARVTGGDRVFEDMTEVEKYLQVRYPRLPADAVARRARWGYRQREDGGWVPLASARALDLVVEGLRTPWDREFREATAPLTCVRGRDSAVVSSEAWETGRDARPDARWTVIDGVDHYVPEEQPRAVTDEILAALDAK